MTQRPARTEAAEYYFTYIDKALLAPAHSIADALVTQEDDVLSVCRTISEARAAHRYARDKWSLRQVLSHINDTERLFTYRAMWFARGFDAALPSFDQDLAIASAGADDRSWASHVEEFEAVRASSVALFRHMPDAAWMRSGLASGCAFTVRALAFITVGHVAHHLAIVRERYLCG
jgi:hypothetical protein